jgi:hypothetical protein
MGDSEESLDGINGIYGISKKALSAAGLLVVVVGSGCAFGWIRNGYG